MTDPIEDTGCTHEEVIVRVTVDDDGYCFGSDSHAQTSRADHLVDALLYCLRGIGAQHGPSLQVELAKRIGDLI